ncbi:unnamed protein product [Ectocarpus fasciculatus]
MAAPLGTRHRRRRRWKKTITGVVATAEGAAPCGRGLGLRCREAPPPPPPRAGGINKNWVEKTSEGGCGDRGWRAWTRPAGFRCQRR